MPFKNTKKQQEKEKKNLWHSFYSPKFSAVAVFLFFSPEKRSQMIKNTKQNSVYISDWFYSLCMAAAAAGRGTERNQTLQETAETEGEML